MSFVILDISLLVLFCIASFLFFKRNRKYIHREGWMYLYKAQWGVQLMDRVVARWHRLLKPLQYVVITSGYVLMLSMIALLIKTLLIYLTQTDDSPLAKIPAVFPLIPYFPQLFNLDSVFPPFYFTYFIIAIALVAVAHEFAHGIFARLNKVRIKSTGVACLGPFLGAFVEQDDKQMMKASKKAQLAILAAGTFANVVLALLFSILLAGFFLVSFTPQGYSFDNYAYTVVNASSLSVPSLTTLGQKQYQHVTQGNATYFLDAQANLSAVEGQLLLAYEDTPAFRAQISNVITHINALPITSYATLNATLRSLKPNQTITLTTLTQEGPQETSLTLGEREGRAYLGIMTVPYQRKGLLGAWYQIMSSVKDPHVTYQSKFTGAQFIYDLLWWIVIINILVALFNMFPAGMLDGGRFFLLTIWGITGSKKAGEYAFKAGTWLLLGVLAIMMVKWVFVIL